MTFDVEFQVNPMTLDVDMGTVYDVTGDEYERGYAAGEQAGYAAGKQEGYSEGEAAGYTAGYQAGTVAGKIDVSSLDHFAGTATGTPGEFELKSVSDNSIWVASNRIPFEGAPGKQYTATAALKCGEKLTNFGIAFLHDDGTYAVSPRYSLSEYFIVSISSAPDKTVVAVGYVYGDNGPGRVKDFLVQEF